MLSPVKGFKMYIIDNKNNIDLANKISRFTIVLSDKKEGETMVDELKLLANDDYFKIWRAFKGKKAQQLLSSVIDGLIVFLSCECEKNTITGEFFSLDGTSDSGLLTEYVHEAQNDASIKIEDAMLA